MIYSEYENHRGGGRAGAATHSLIFVKSDTKTWALRQIASLEATLTAMT